MRLAYFILLALALPAMAADGPVAKPDVQPDDRWAYRRTDLATNKIGRYELTVTFANREMIHGVIRRGNPPEEVDADWTAEWNVMADPNAGIFTPHTGFLKFPLQIGARHKAAFELQRPRKGAFASSTEVTMRVVGWEEISVPAGRFRALRIEGDGTYRRQDVSGSGTVRHVFWYAPELKRWAKYTFENTDFKGRPFLRYADELVEYRVR